MSYLDKQSNETFSLRICSEDILKQINNLKIQGDCQCENKQTITLVLSENAQLFLSKDSDDGIQEGKYFTPRFLEKVEYCSIADL